MAKIGLRYPLYAKYTEGENGEVSYSDAVTIGKAIKADINITVSDVKQYGDDEIAEESHEFNDGTISLETTDLSAANYASLLGHSTGEDENEDEIICRDTDKSIFVGFGFYARKQVNGMDAWRAIWFPKVIFSEPNDSLETKGETITFGSDTIEGSIRKDPNGIWKRERTFTTKEAALAWIKAKANAKGDN